MLLALLLVASAATAVEGNGLLRRGEDEADMSVLSRMYIKSIVVRNASEELRAHELTLVHLYRPWSRDSDAIREQVHRAPRAARYVASSRAREARSGLPHLPTRARPCLADEHVRTHDESHDGRGERGLPRNGCDAELAHRTPLRRARVPDGHAVRLPAPWSAARAEMR